MRSQYFRNLPSIFGRETSVNTTAANVVLSHAVPDSPTSASTNVAKAQLSSTAMTASSMSAAGGKRP
jgi:hypothetical protein